MGLPESVQSKMISFLKSLPVEENSYQWKNIQGAISLLLFPKSFDKKIHFFIKSSFYAREEGCYIKKEISIKIYTNKFSVTRTFKDWASWRDKNINKTYRYIFPNEKYCTNDFFDAMEDLSDLFTDNYCISDSDAAEHSINRGNYYIESNFKI